MPNEKTSYWIAPGLIDPMPPPLSHILQETCKFMGVEVEAVQSRKRNAPLVTARQMFCFVASKYEDYNSTEIMWHVKRDRSTATYCIRRVRDLAETDKQYRKQLEALQKIVKQ